MAKWLVYNKKADFKAMATEYGVDQVLARIMINRDLTEPEEIRSFLQPSKSDLHAPELMKDMLHGVALIKEAIQEKKRIRVIGDYDIDGIQATYILHQGLLRVGAKVDYAIPHRIKDGYGVNVEMMEACHEDGVAMIITCDNGISARDAVARAKELGIQVVVTDHHEVPYEMVQGEKVYLLPEADAIINPKQADCEYPCKKLCGAVVAWKVVQALYQNMGIPVEEGDVFIENAAVATIGDVMELVEENRSIVALGLKALQNTKNIGMQALIKRCELDQKAISAYHIGFVLGPCMNASGRLDSATKALEMLEATDVTTAIALAHTLYNLNQERKVMTEQGTNRAIEKIEQECLDQDLVLVVYLPEVHESVAGIIAGRLREKYEQPVFVLTDSAEEGEIKGSGRSMEGYDMYDEMCKCKELLLKFGGHTMAAGLSLKKDDLDAFRQKINQVATVRKEELSPVIHIDVPMPFGYISKDLIEQLEQLEPFGNGNPKPVFAQQKVLVKDKRVMGKNKNILKLQLEDQQGWQIEGLYFGDISEFEQTVSSDGRLHITYYPQINTYGGREKLQIVVTNICTI